MRKILVFSIFLTAIFAGFDVCAATARGGRSVASTLGATENAEQTETSKDATDTQDQQNTAVAARAANRNRVKQNTVTAQNTTSARVATRTSAARSAVPKAPVQTSPSTTTTGTGVKARAATKQKAVNLGTKITTATENTVVPQECQDAFYGCMDSFCMLDNTSGGRCRCDDRSADLDIVLEQIQKLDAQSKTLAQEGVERLQRGDAVDTIYSMAEDAANKVIADQKKNEKDLSQLAQEGKKKARGLDLSTFNSNLFDTDDLFGSGDIFDTSIVDKTGNALRTEAIKLCTPKVPQQCREYASMLQLVYAQKVKSDCVAYENDLKQQKMNSENLLQTAQKAVRDAAAEAYENSNKYDLGQCTLRFRQCMTGEDVCGAGFSKCVVNKMVVSQSSSKMKKVKTGTTVIELEATTYDAVVNNKAMCEHVLKQCVLVKDKVWDEFLRNIAPELKSAEYAAEDEQRRNCSKNIVSCIKEAASAEGLEEGSDSWSIFTSNMDNVKKICKVQLEQCKAYDKDIEEGIMYYVTLSLNAVRADRCTTKIKQCLQNNCGKDYLGCLGASMKTLRGFCSDDEIEIDCKDKTDEKGSSVDLDKYINQVAQGLIFNVNNAMVEGCIKAINASMNTYCGGTDTCNNANIDFSDIWQEYVTYRVCPANINPGDSADKAGTCKKDISAFSTADVSCPKWETKRFDALWTSDITMNLSGGDDIFGYNGKANITRKKRATAKLNSAFKTVNNLVNSDINLKRCIDGLTAENFNGETIGVDEQLNAKQRVVANAGGAASTNNRSSVTKYTSAVQNNLKQTIANAVYDRFIAQYNARVAELQTDIDSANATINEYYKSAGLVCPSQSSNGTESSDDNTSGTETVACTGKCELGNCNCCDGAEKKCQCIAYTYFQATHVKHHNNTLGEVTQLAGVKYSGDSCTISFRRHKNCYLVSEFRDDSYYAFVRNASDAWTGWDCTSHDDVRKVVFNLSDNTNISVDDGCQPKNGDWLARRLTIGETQICFNKCTSQIKQSLVDANGVEEKFVNWAGADIGSDVWCGHDDFNKVAGNGTYVTDTDSKNCPINGTEVKHANYKFYDLD